MSSAVSAVTHTHAGPDAPSVSPGLCLGQPSTGSHHRQTPSSPQQLGQLFSGAERRRSCSGCFRVLLPAPAGSLQFKLPGSVGRSQSSAAPAWSSGGGGCHRQLRMAQPLRTRQAAEDLAAGVPA